MPFVICLLENIRRELRWRSLQDGLTLTAENIPGWIGCHCCMMSPQSFAAEKNKLFSQFLWARSCPRKPFSPP